MLSTLHLQAKDDDEGWVHATKMVDGLEIHGLVPCTHLENRLEPSNKDAAVAPPKPPAPTPAAAGNPPLQNPVPDGAGLELDKRLVAELPLYAVAMFEFEGESPDELSFKQGDVVYLKQLAEDEGWVEARLASKGESAQFLMAPMTHLSKRVARTAEELQGARISSPTGNEGRHKASAQKDSGDFSFATRNLDRQLCY